MHGLRLLLTCRRDVVAGTGEVRDGVDAELVGLLARHGHQVHLVPNHPGNLRGFLRAVDPQGVVLSGGNDVDPSLYARRGPGHGVSVDRDAVELALIRLCRRKGLPLLGICRGLQLLNVAFGGILSHDLGTRDGREGHVAVRHRIRILDTFPAADWRGREAKVNSFHNHGVAPEDLARGLVPMALSPDGMVEALRHPRLPIFAVQWHPERKGSAPALDQALLEAVFPLPRGRRR